MSLLDYTAKYLNNLPENHPINISFGKKLSYIPENELAEENNIFLFRYPVSNGEVDDITYSEKEGICILEIGGRPADPNMGCYYPYLVIRCRHKYPGVAFNTLQEIGYELQDNARVFPQNGVLYLATSSPVLIQADKMFFYTYQLVFRTLSAEPIK